MKKTHSKLIDIVSILHGGNYHDGTSIGKQLNITRSAVWKLIKKLEKHGVDIDSVKGKGYALEEPLTLLNKATIPSGLDDKEIKLEIFESIPSTNDYFKNEAKQQHKTICATEVQTQGRGRLKRKWHSPFAKNIMFSYYYTFQKDITELAGLSLVVSLAIINALNHYTLPDALKVKWPNDVFYRDNKVAGTLIELQAESNGLCSAIMGTGINVNMRNDKSHTIDQPWTSLSKILNDYIERNHLFILVINSLSNYLNRFEQFGLTDFHEEFKQVDYLFGKPTQLNCIDTQYTGNAKGINHLGHLLLEFNNKKQQAFSFGDASLVRPRK